MFIKKDLRKIPRIMEDAPDCPSPSSMDATNDELQQKQKHRDKRFKGESSLSELRLGRRHQEFQGSLQILCQPKYIPKMQNLKSLNLYDCGISNVDQIGLLAECPALELLNLGRNPLQELSPDLAKLQSLKHIWLDDCQLSGSIPTPLLELSQLETLRMPNNQITDIFGIAKLSKLKLLCLDRNQLVALPNELGRLSELEELYVRHNELSALPSTTANAADDDGTMTTECFAALSSLHILHLSSNQLTDIDAVAGCTALTHLYANANQLTAITDEFVAALLRSSTLRRLVVSHNPITSVSAAIWNWTITKDDDCEIVWHPNPDLTPVAAAVAVGASDQDTGSEDVDMTPVSTE
jgi:Leucine-rich repeat (LRR) protein